MSKKKHTKKRPAVAKKAPEKKSKMPKWLQNIWQKFAANRGLSAVIAALAVVLVAAIVVAIVVKVELKNRPKGPGVQITQDFYHETPEGLDVKNLVQLKSEDAKEYLCRAGAYSPTAEPKPYEKGWYIFDNNGIARKYRDDEGKIHDLPLSEQVEHVDVTMGAGIPLQIFGDVKIQCLVYKNAEGTQPKAYYLYFTLSDKTDMECLLWALKSCGFAEIQQVSDTVAEIAMDEYDIADEMYALYEEYNLETLLKYLELQYNVKS